MALIKCYIKDIDRNFNPAWGYGKPRHDLITNARISAECLLEQLEREFSLKYHDIGFGRQIKKSPYSYSFYIDLIGKDGKEWSIRLSDHLANGFSNDHLHTFYTDNNFVFRMNSVDRWYIKRALAENVC